MPQTLQICKMVVARLCFLSLLCIKMACFAPTRVQNNRITSIGGTVLAPSSGGPFEEEKADESETNETKIVNPFYGVHRIQRYSTDDLFLRQLRLVLSGHHPEKILLGYPFHEPIVGNEKSEVLCLGFTLVPVTLGESRGRTVIL